jgi:diguanylate cyclase (GGDEF)-like protein
MLLVRFFRGARAFVRAVSAPLCAFAIATLAARDAFRTLTSPALALLGVAVLAAIARLRARARVRRTDTHVPPIDGGAAVVFVAIAYAVVSATGGSMSSPVSALPLVTVAAVAALSAPRAGVLVALFALVTEALALRFHPGGDPRWLALRSLVVLAAAALHHGLTRTEIARVRAHAEKLLEDERTRQKEAAKSFRLVSAPSAAPRAPGHDDDNKKLRSSLDVIRESLTGLLEITRRALGLKTCAIFWVDAKGESLRLVEFAAEDEESVSFDPITIGAGAVGGACAMGRPVVLSKLRPDYGGLSYYTGPHGVKAFAAMPIVDDGNVRGVLVADRADDRAFEDDEQATLSKVAEQALRHVHNERVFGALEKSKDELAKLFQASRALGEALTEDEVIAAVATSAKSVVEHDLVVLASYDEKTHEHKIRHVAGGISDKLERLSFGDNSGLASAAVKARHALPYKGHFDPKTQYLFTRNVAMEGYESVLCLPLVVRDHAIGTLTLAAKRRNAFPDATRQLLGVLAANAAVAMSNASAVRRLEEMATTDPMTNLLNKRALEAEFERRIRSAARFGKRLSVLVTDIDKFKSVNDTYGHAVGDVVIKGLGQVLTKCKRETDAVARFGGEEFVIVCEETDTEGAYALAERIRTELAATTFATEMGPLKVTCSLGVAEFPRDGQNRADLFTRADEALYEAKRNGRNQTRIAGKRNPPVTTSNAAPPSGTSKRRADAA